MLYKQINHIYLNFIKTYVLNIIEEIHFGFQEK